MRKQTKLVAVLSAAALLAIGASMTSFAAGWQKDDDGTWHYYDKDDNMIEDEWKKDGGKWFYLDEDGNMLIDSWVDDEYYVDENGAMIINGWRKTISDDSVDDPDDDGEHWYYFNSKGKKVSDQHKKINGKTYYFDEDGKMRTGWHQEGTDAFYLGSEDEGWRAENQWLWLEKSGNDDDNDDDDIEVVLGCSSGDNCDDEGWYWFGSDGKVCTKIEKKKINGKYYYFNDHGQMLYEWINDKKVKPASGTPSNAQLDGIASPGTAGVGDMKYYNPVEEGWRADGWYEIDGAEDLGQDGDSDWYYFKDGKVKKADTTGVSADYVVNDDDGSVYRARIKVDSSKGKRYFCFNEYGQMQDGLQYIPDDKGFYYFDSLGYMQTGKVAEVECDDDDYSFYFNTKNGKNGEGFNGEKDGYLYFNGKRLEADDDYRLYYWNGDVYLVNKKGKIQKSKSAKDFDIENSGINQEDVEVTFSKNTVTRVKGVGFDYTAAQLISNAASTFDTATGDYDDSYVSIPFISLYDDDMYTYDLSAAGAEGWYDVHDRTWK